MRSPEVPARNYVGRVDTAIACLSFHFHRCINLVFDHFTCSLPCTHMMCFDLFYTPFCLAVTQVTSTCSAYPLPCSYTSLSLKHLRKIVYCFFPNFYSHLCSSARAFSLGVSLDRREQLDHIRLGSLQLGRITAADVNMRHDLGLLRASRS